MNTDKTPHVLTLTTLETLHVPLPPTSTLCPSTNKQNLIAPQGLCTAF